MNHVEASNIHFAYGERGILHGVDLSVRAGEMIGLIGPNGAGKSTLMKILAGLSQPSGGSVKLRNEDLASLTPRKVARTIGYLPQGQEVHWPLSVDRLVSLGRIPHLAPWQSPDEADAAAVEKAMRAVDVWHLRERPVNELAGGERTLVLIARALAADPDLVLADEPVAGLDPHHQIQVMETLLKLTTQDHGVVVVLHDLNLAARYCHRLFLLHQGSLLASGAPREVLSAENLKNSYHIEARTGEVDHQFFLVPWRRL